MKKTLAVAVVIVAVSGCSTIKQYWPRDHDPVMFDHLVTVDLAIAHINCDRPDWQPAMTTAQQLAQYADWRGDPQAENLKGLAAHTERMSKSTSPAFCELGQKTARQRIDAARAAWKGR
jgi:hypothetical protein